MIKAKGEIDGRPVLLLGLSHRNLDILRQYGHRRAIHINKEDIDIPFDIHIIAGKDEAELGDLIAPLLTPDAKIHVSDRLKQ